MKARGSLLIEVAGEESAVREALDSVTSYLKNSGDAKVVVTRSERSIEQVRRVRRAKGAAAVAAILLALLVSPVSAAVDVPYQVPTAVWAYQLYFGRMVMAKCGVSLQTATSLPVGPDITVTLRGEPAAQQCASNLIARMNGAIRPVCHRHMKNLTRRQIVRWALSNERGGVRT